MKPRTSATRKKATATKKISKTPTDDPLAKHFRTNTDQIAERIIRGVNIKHQKVNESLRAIRSQGFRLLGPAGSKTTTQCARAKLIALYQTAQKQCESEHSSLEQLLGNIQKIHQLRLKLRMSDKLSRGSLMVLLAQHAANLPLYIGSIDGNPPPLVCYITKVGAIPQIASDPIPVGHFVAAFVEDVWILAEVKNQASNTNYLIRDIDDDDDEGEKDKYITISSNLIIPLPHFRADPRRHAHALFPKMAIVLALYPQTTCFYKGVVETPPAGPNDDYLITFEDPTFSSGYSGALPVPQLYVVKFIPPEADL